MKISKIEAENIGPIKKLIIKDMKNITMIAGVNGSGKTFLKNEILKTFQEHNKQFSFNNTSKKVATTLNLTIIPETEDEKINFGEPHEIVKGERSEKLSNHMSPPVKGALIEGVIVDIDTNRNANEIKQTSLSSGADDPEKQAISRNVYLEPFNVQWDKIIKDIHEKQISFEREIAKYVTANENGKETLEEINSQFQNPFIKYKEAFGKLLPGKTLENVDSGKMSNFKYKIEGFEKTFTFNQLSSGEQEVVKIAFLLIHRDFRHSIFLIDEPELHLHPSLTINLTNVITALGDKTNQFIFFTHSNELISKYLWSGNVYFIENEYRGENQAIKADEALKERPELTRIMSQNLGLFALGRNLLFVEGTEDSLDLKLYKKISGKTLNDCIVVPIGGCLNLVLLAELVKEIKKGIFGINIYIIRDRDEFLETEINNLEPGSKLRFLKKRCLENYLLDPQVLAKVSKQLCLDNKYRAPEQITKELKKICDKNKTCALNTLMKGYFKRNFNLDSPVVKGVDKPMGEEDLLSKYIKDAQSKLDALNQKLNNSIPAGLAKQCAIMNKAILNERWKDIFPGKMVFKQLCKTIKGDEKSVAEAYIDIAISEHPEVFADITQILKEFKDC